MSRRPGGASRHCEPSPRTNHHRHRTACLHTLAPPHAARRSVGGMKNARHTRGAANARTGGTLSVRSCQQTRICTRRAMVRQQYEHIAAPHRLFSDRNCPDVHFHPRGLLPTLVVFDFVQYGVASISTRSEHIAARRRWMPPSFGVSRGWGRSGKCNYPSLGSISGRRRAGPRVNSPQKKSIRLHTLVDHHRAR